MRWDFLNPKLRSLIHMMQQTVIYSDCTSSEFWCCSCITSHIQESEKFMGNLWELTEEQHWQVWLEKIRSPFFIFCICAENDSYFGFIGSAVTTQKSRCNLHAKHLRPSQKLKVINDSANFANFPKDFQSFLYLFPHQHILTTHFLSFTGISKVPHTISSVKGVVIS